MGNHLHYNHYHISYYNNCFITNLAPLDFAIKAKAPPFDKGRGQRGGNVNMSGVSRLFKPHRRSDYSQQPMTYIYKKTEP